MANTTKVPVETALALHMRLLSDGYYRHLSFIVAGAMKAVLDLKKQMIGQIIDELLERVAPEYVDLVKKIFIQTRVEERSLEYQLLISIDGFSGSGSVFFVDEVTKLLQIAPSDLFDVIDHLNKVWDSSIEFWGDETNGLVAFSIVGIGVSGKNFSAMTYPLREELQIWD